MERSKLAAGIVLILLIVLSNGSGSQVIWQRFPQNPVIKAAGQFLLALEPSVLYDSAHGRYDMWFTGKNPKYTSSFAVYHARSTVRARWLIDLTGPVLYPDPRGSYDSEVRGPSVIRDKAGYKMYFLAQGESGYSFGVATSPDGITWTKYSGNPIIMKGASGTWDSQAIAYPNVYFDGSMYYLWYSGSDGNTGSIGLATSSDGLTWSKYANNPILRASAETWDARGVGQPSVAFANGKFYMLYDASLTTYCCASRIGAATSTDGIHWIKYVNNPVFVPGSAGSWDDEAVSTGSLVFRKSSFQFWYSALSASTGLWQTGYAMSPVVGIDSLSKLDGGKALVGFTAGSWTAKENHDIKSREFRTSTTESNKSKTGGSNDIFSVGLAPQHSRIVLNGKVEIINTGKSGSSQSRLRFKGIFGLARESGGPFEEDSIAVTTGDDFFVQVASGLYYEVFVKHESRKGVTLKFSRMLKRK